MRVPLRWLRDYVDVVLSPAELAHRLTMAGLEVDSVVTIGAEWDHIYVGQVVELSPHPNADRLQLVTAEYGRSNPITLVTGAFNLKVGDKVPVALVGARLFDGHGDSGQLITLKPSKLRGVISEGMVCSGKELGISEDHAGILVLSPEARVGAPLHDELGDVIFDLSLTPNRSDALSLLGVAREVAALTGQKVRYPNIDVPEEGTPAAELAKVEIADPDLCPRYSAMIIRGVRIGPSPIWMQERLTAAGVRPISNIVDVTNYVMLEMGEPMHAFDLAKVHRQHIIVRRARPGETFVTLDGQERRLTEDMLLIADPERGIGLAGVMGGLNTEISDETTDIILEAANFNPISNRRTARALNLPTEASRRFEKGLPPEITVPALRRAMRLMHELAGGQVAPGVIDAYPNPTPRSRITLPGGEMRRLLGVDVPRERVESILTSLEFEMKREGDGWAVTAPPHRVDVSLPADLVEEVARIIGYEAIPDTLLRGELPPQVANRARERETAVRQALVGSGLAEIIGYSLTSRARLGRLMAGTRRDGRAQVVARPYGRDPRPPAPPLPAVIDPALYSGKIEPLSVLNPLSSEAEVLRTTTLAGMLDTLRDNLRHSEREVDLFELGKVYLPRAGDLPDERRFLTIGLGGLRSGRALGERTETDFFDLKGIVDAVLATLGIERAAYVPVTHPVLHPGRAALVCVDAIGPDGLTLDPLPGAKIVGVLGEVNRQVAEAFDISSQRLYLAALDLEALLGAGSEERSYRPLPKYPPVNQDIAIVVDAEVPAEVVRRRIMAAGGDLLREASLFDVYSGPPIPAGKRGLAYSLTYQAADHTLTDEEVRRVHRRIEETLLRAFGAQIRGQ